MTKYQLCFITIHALNSFVCIAEYHNWESIDLVLCLFGDNSMGYMCYCVITCMYLLNKYYC